MIQLCMLAQGVLLLKDLGWDGDNVTELRGNLALPSNTDMRETFAGDMTD